jgi:hypothetical protein
LNLRPLVTERHASGTVAGSPPAFAISVGASITGDRGDSAEQHHRRRDRFVRDPDAELPERVAGRHGSLPGSAVWFADQA